MNSLLLIEDDPVLGRGLVVRLELEGYTVTWVQDLRSAREQCQAHLKSARFQAIILDRGLPDGDGSDFCSELRQGGCSTPVLILTAQTDEDSVVHGLNAGANDYIRKPFGHRELLARIKAAMRELPSSRPPLLTYGELSISLEQRKVFTHNRSIDLNRREFDLLVYFLERPEIVVTREALLEALDKSGEIYDRTIDSHISHTRTKLKQAGVTSVQISSVYGVGYRLEKK
jgi:DNA-binding response OmpR family regulator